MKTRSAIVLVETLRDGVARVMALSPAPPRMATRPVARLSLLPGEGPLLVRVTGDVATLEGSRDNFALIANELMGFKKHNDSDEPGMHIHFDPSERQYGGPCIAEESVEMVVTGPVPDD